jgi:hypothetical protein
VTIPSAYQTLAALAGTVALAFGAVNYFQPRAAAAAEKQEVQRTVEELRAELLLTRAKVLNAKENRTADEQIELELTLAQVKAIQAALAAKKGK